MRPHVEFANQGVGSTSCKTFSNAGEYIEAGYQVNTRYEGIIIRGTPKKIGFTNTII